MGHAPIAGKDGCGSNVASMALIHLDPAVDPSDNCSTFDTKSCAARPISRLDLDAIVPRGSIMNFGVMIGGPYRALTKNFRRRTGDTQDTDIYFDPKFAELLETW